MYHQQRRIRLNDRVEGRLCVICNAIAASPDRDHDKTKNEWSEKMIIIIMLPHTPKKNIHRFVVWSARVYFQIAVTCYSFSLRSWNKIRTSASECLCVFSMYHGNMTTWRHTYIFIYIPSGKTTLNALEKLDELHLSEKWENMQACNKMKW